MSVKKNTPSENSSLQSDFFWKKMPSPIGPLTVFANDEGITEIRFPNKEPNSKALNSNLSDKPEKNYSNRIVDNAIDQLQAYFDGKLKTFDLPLRPSGTEFQKTVWRKLQQIGYGRTASYGDIAAAIVKPKASRAVGMANSKNPIPIVVPCHRIIGKDGSLTGFAGGLDTKRWLLAHEQG
ncbi:MAG: methylated-DNA--[protein]-cysteine S-methyltransferase [Porticoccaceae bacterium]